MLARILSGTPTWVFLLFFALLALGILQTRSRLIAPARVAILPAAFLAFSLYGVVSTFGTAPVVLALWVAGIGTAVLLNRVSRQPAGVRWDAHSGAFHVPGSWVPLGLMMAVFFARYAIAVTRAMQPAFAGTPAFAAIAAFAYGLMSGMFLARALHIWSRRGAQP